MFLERREREREKEKRRETPTMLHEMLGHDPLEAPGVERETLRAVVLQEVQGLRLGVRQQVPRALRDEGVELPGRCLLYTSPSPRDGP